MARSAASRRGYRDEPSRSGAAGSAFVLTIGILLMVAALAGGYVLKVRPDLVSLDDKPQTADIAEVCAAVKDHNTNYRKQVTDIFQVGVQAILDGDEAASNKAEADITAKVKEWAGKLRDEGNRTDNAELRDALATFEKRLEPVESGAAGLNDLNTIVDESAATVEKYCPGSGTATSPSPTP